MAVLSGNPDSRLERRIAGYAGTIGLVVAAAGLLVLAGWALDIAALKSVLPGLATMKPITALAFVLSGASLWWSRPRAAGTRSVSSGLGRVLAVLVGVLGLLTLGDYVFGWALGLHTFLFRDAVVAEGEPVPGRMSLLAALDFTLLGAGLLLLDVTTRGGIRPSHWLALASAANAFVALLGYLFDVQGLYQIVPDSSIALHSAVLVLLLSLGLVCIRPGTPLVRQIAGYHATGVINRRLLPAVIMIPPLLGWLLGQDKQAGYYGSSFHESLLVASTVAIFTALAWWSARAAGQSRAHLHALVVNEPECVKLLGADGALLDMNPAGLRMIEADSLEQVRGLCMYPLIVEEYRAAFRALNETVQAGGSGTLEFEIVGLKGGRRWLETHASPLLNVAGEITTLGITRDITGRKAAEALLAQQLSEMEQLYQTAPVGLALLDDKLRFVRVNELLAAIDGRSVADHIGRTLEEVVPALSGELRNLQQGVLDTGLPVLDLEISGVTPAEPAVERHWLVNYLPVRDGDGVVVGVSAVVVDITEHKQAEAALHAREQLLSESQRIAHIGSWIWGLAGPISWSEETYRIYGMPPDTFPPDVESFLDLIHPEDRPAMQAWITAGIAGGQPGELEFRVILSDGTVRYLSGRGELNRDAEGRPTHLAGTVQDITDRKQVESALRRNEKILRQFVEHSPAAIAMFDRDMNYILSSRRYLADYGLTNQILEGRCHYEVLPDIPDAWKQIHQRCLSGAIEKAEADPFPRADGKLDWVRWEIHPWRESSGDIGGIILFSEVITARVEAKQQLRVAALRQQRLARRMVELQEAEQRRLSAELHDRIGQYLTALSINLNIISGSNGPAHDQATATRLEDSQRLLETTIASVRNLIVELRPPALDDYGLLAGLRWFAEQVQRRTGLQFSVLGEEQSPRLETRVEYALFRIAQEALNNIAKHAHAQRVVLALQREAGKVTLSIADDGRGFDPPTLQQPGLREHWGLEMMRERAEAVGAILWVESIPGQGTRILVDVEVAP